MQYRSLGRTGVEVSEIGFGTWSMGSMWGERDDEAAVKALDLAIDIGVNFFDTAFAYGDGHSERLIGRVVKDRAVRGRVFIATKVPPKDYHWPARAKSKATDIFPRKWIRETTEKSLKNLKTDFVDLQQLHVWAADWAQETEWLEELKKLKKEGKVRFYGISINDHDPLTAIDVVNQDLIDSVQVIYNLYDQTPAQQLLPLCREHRVGVIARVPFDEGGLTGRLTPETQFEKEDWRRFYFKGDRLRQACERAERLKEFIGREGVETLPQLALKFCLSHPAVSTVIPGMRRPEHLQSNCAASDGRPLSERMLADLKGHAWPRNFYPKWEEEGF